jgi:hypothetical protein
LRTFCALWVTGLCSFLHVAVVDSVIVAELLHFIKLPASCH